MTEGCILKAPLTVLATGSWPLWKNISSSLTPAYQVSLKEWEENERWENLREENERWENLREEKSS